MNDSLRTDVFVRYPPETVAVACIYLSARKLRVPLPGGGGGGGGDDASWLDVLGVEEDDIKDCCYRMICLYNRKKVRHRQSHSHKHVFIKVSLSLQPNQEELENLVESLRRKFEESRRAARQQHQQPSSAQAGADAASSAAASAPGSRGPSPRSGVDSGTGSR